ncbi:MAG: dihydrolipoyl dehydrogenase [Saprospiraceae bacterium]|nr:dihydrolipoyl dehydrogenase [Saprospiraceae bacterium]
MKKYDVIVIGSGPGGYVAAIRAAQLGMNTAIIERYPTLGGTCSNVGCIPSKALLDSSEHYYNALHAFDEHGIQLKELQVDLRKMIARKNEVVKQTTDGVAFLMKKNKIEVHQGHATFVDAHTVEVTADDGSKERFEGSHIIIATGSKPVVPEAFNYDKKRVITSTEALNIEKLPKKLVVVGAGVIGLELGSVFARLGTEVTVVEYLDRALATMDKDCSREIARALKKIGITFHFNHQVSGVEVKRNGVNVTVQKREGEETFDVSADYCLVAIGRKPYTDGLGLDEAGIKTDDKGRIIVNDAMQTNVEGVYAIGDVVRGVMLAHKAEDEGIFVAESIAGQKPHIDYNLIPLIVYTWPEVAAVGKTEEELKETGTPYKAGKFPFRALGRARASGDLGGMVKILAHAETDEVLGVHMVGARVADVIMEAVTAMEFRASAEDIARICHPHPTYTEAVREAALGATGDRPLHL